MGYPTKVQLIERKASEQFYINFPAPIAQAMDFAKGTASVWTSPDGANWTKNADVGAIAIGSIVAVGDRLVILGAKADSQLGMVPASWSSSDGASWIESSASGPEPAMAFDAATVVGGSIIAIGTSHASRPATTLGPGESMPTP